MGVEEKENSFDSLHMQTHIRFPNKSRKFSKIIRG